MIIKLLILALVNAIIFPESKGELPVPQNVSACVIYEDNDTLLNVQWNIMGFFNPQSASYTVHYFSNESDVGFEKKFVVQPADSENITDLFIPANFTGQQLRVQVIFTFNRQERASTSLIVDIRPVYLASFEAINNTGNVTTLEITFNLACDIESEATYIVEIVPLNNNTDSNTSQRQTHNITDEDVEENLFHPQQVLTFFDVMMGFDYTVQARLLSSEGDMIGQEFQTVISVPFATDTTPEPTVATTAGAMTTIATGITTTMSPSEIGQPVSSIMMQSTSADTPQTSTTTSMEATTTVSNTPILARDPDSESDDSSSIGIAIGVSIGCVLLLVLAITLCIIIIYMKRNDNSKKSSSKGSDDYSKPEESFVCTNRFSCSSTTVLHNASPMQDRRSHQERTSQKHDYSLPPDANYVLYEETPQIGNSKSSNAIPSHYETAENQEIQILPFLSNGHYEMSDTIMYNPASLENANQTYYSELVHNSHQSSNDIPPVPSGAYDYDQLGHSTNENMNTNKRHHYDSLTSTESTSHQKVQETNGYTELQDSTANQSKPYQSLTTSNNTQVPKFHQYEEVKSHKATVAVDENYSEPYNLKNKKLLPHHEYDVVTGDVNPPPRGSFVREYSEPRDTLNVYLH